MDLKAQIQALLVVSRWRRIDTDDDDDIDSMAVNISFYRGWLYISMNFLLGEYFNGLYCYIPHYSGQRGRGCKKKEKLYLFVAMHGKLKQDGGLARRL